MKYLFLLGYILQTCCDLKMQLYNTSNFMIFLNVY